MSSNINSDVSSETRVLVAWSGGKDSLMALWKLPPWYKVAALLTNVDVERDRVSVHGVRREMVVRQADALGLPVSFVPLSSRPTNAEYEAIFADAVKPYHDQGIRHIVYGDLFLEDIRRYRDAQLSSIRMEGIYPLWAGYPQIDT